MSFEHEMELLGLEVERGAEHLARYHAANPTHGTELPVFYRGLHASLSLNTFYTCSREEVKAWHLEANAPSTDAAGCIHTDVERGFIATSVLSFENLKDLGSEEEVARKGFLRQQGKRYVIQDGDILFFQFRSGGKR